MHYKVYFLDGYEITGVENVELSHERDVKIYNGLGQGNFPVPDDKDLKTWTIKCEQDADTSLFKTLEKLLDTQKESRLIINSDVDSISEMVLLKGYTKNEQDMGVYDVTIKFIEYKEVGIRTTDVPYIARGGKIPIPPKTVVLGGTGKGGKTPFTVAQSFIDNSRKSQELSIKMFDSNGKQYTNPCLIPKDKPVYLHESGTVAIVIGDNYKGSFSDQLLQEQIAKQSPEGRKKAEQQRKAKEQQQKAKEAMEKAKKEAMEKIRKEAIKNGSLKIV